MKRKIELLAPAGGRAALEAAVNNGCDAVYMGGKGFSARSHAENFDGGGLASAIDYAHLRGVKAYITVNTLYNDSEFGALLSFCAEAYRAGADALILQDIGAARLIHDTFDIDLHASTQMTVRTAEDVEFLRKFGFKRFILARETPFEEIRRIAETGAETEVFAHGALCCSHSGQCLMSAFIGGRSGNRGNCAQPCRLEYTLSNGGETLARGGLLSPKDLCALDIIGELADIGVTAVKIEGRMKSPQYVALAAKAYREAIDGTAPSPGIKAELAQVFSRGGEFCGGYFKTHSSPGMISASRKSSGAFIGEVVKYIPQTGTCLISLTEGGLCGGDGIVIYSKEQGRELAGAYCNSPSALAAGELAAIEIRPENPSLFPKKGDAVYKSYDRQLDSRLKTLAAAQTRKLALTGFAEAKADHRLKFALVYNDISVTEYGNAVERALKQPIDKNRVLGQLAKTGGTPFEIVFDGCDIDDGIYIDIKDINETRRRAVAEMERRIAGSFKRTDAASSADFEGMAPVPPTGGMGGGAAGDTAGCMPGGCTGATPAKDKYTVLANTVEQALAALEYAPHTLYLECNPEILDSLPRIISANISCVRIFAALPPLCGVDLIPRLESSGIDGYLARTYGHLQTLESLGSVKDIALDYSFNVMNSASFALLGRFAGSVCLSPELKDPDAISAEGTAAAERVVYGRTTLMTTNLCPVGMSVGKGGGKHCRMRGKPGTYILTNPHGMEFPVLRDCEACVARILSPVTDTGVGRRLGGGLSNPPRYLRLDFTTESAAECGQILKAVFRSETD